MSVIKHKLSLSRRELLAAAGTSAIAMAGFDLLAGCGGGGARGGSFQGGLTGRLVLDAEQPAGSGAIPATGGQVVLNVPGSPINGLVISAPDGAFVGGLNLQIMTAAIKS